MKPDSARQIRNPKTPSRGQVPILNCLEYPAPQPPYLLLMTPPVHLFPGITVEDRARALKSIHRSVQLIPWFWHLLLLRFKGSPAHVGTPFRAGHQARYPASYPPTIREELPVVQSAVSCCVSAAGIRFLDTLSCQTECKYSEILWRACRWPAWLSRHAGAGVLVKGLAGLRWWRGWLCPGAEVFGVGGPGQEPFKAGA